MLEKEREQIDALDKEIVALLEKRMDVVTKIAQIKAENHASVLDASREQQVLDRIASYVVNPAYKESLQAVYAEMMAISRDYQQEINQLK